MKLSKTARFPHPVMDSATGDYKTGSFRVTFEVTEGAAGGKIKFGYQVALDEIRLEALKGDKVTAVVFLICKDTFTDRLFVLDSDSGDFEVDEMNLKGSIELLPLLVATTEIDHFTNHNLHDEFASKSWAFSEADILAIGDPSVFNIGHEKLAPIASIFKLAIKEDLEKDIIEVDVDRDDDVITIFMNRPTRELLENLRAHRRHRPVVLNSIYLPAVIDVLGKLASDPGSLSDKNWFKAFTARFDVMGIDLERIDPFKHAQMLLNEPINKLKILVEDK